MNCSQAEKLLSLAAGGELEAGQLREVEAHIKRCPRCRQTAGEYKKLVELARSTPSLETPNGFDEQFVQQTIGRVINDAQSVRESKAKQRHGFRRRYVFAGAAVVLTIAVLSTYIAVRLQSPQRHKGPTVDKYLARSDFDGLSAALKHSDTGKVLMSDSVTVDLLLQTVGRLRRAHRLHGHVERHISRFLCDMLTGSPVRLIESQRISRPKIRMDVCNNGAELNKALRALRWYRRSNRRIAMTDLIGVLSKNPET